MGYIALSRKWRPQRFDEVVGQAHVVRTLQNALRTNRVHHAYLFSGPRGVGKTTMARLFAKALNCTQREDVEPCNACESCVAIQAGHSLDVVEMDAASNNSVDDIRELRENVKLATVSSRYRVFIVDEAHMLSTAAWNAFLKTLEEPPPHVVFIFASTEKNRFPSTILSRCQQFEFHRMAYEEVVARLRQLLASESFQMDEEGLALVAQQSEGCLRDAQSLLEQLIAYGDGSATVEDVSRMLGYGSAYTLARLTDALVQRNVRDALDATKDLVDQGADLPQCLRFLVNHFHRLLRIKVDPALADTLEASPSRIAEFRKQAERISLERLRWTLKTLMRAERDIKTLGYDIFNFELALVDVCQLEEGIPLAEVLTSLKALESRLEREESVAVAGSLPSSEPVEEPAEKVLPSEWTSEHLAALWSEVVRKIGEQDASLFGSLHGTRLEKRENQLVVLFASRVKLNRVVAKRSFVEQVFSGFAGLRVPLKLALDEADVTASVEPIRGEPPEQELEQTVLSLFNGKMP